MEDATGVDLDWFWRGWFYSTDHVDVAISNVSEFKVSTFDPDVETEFEQETHAMDHPEPLTQIRNREEGKETRVARNPDLEDFYNEHDPFTVTDKQRNDYSSKLEGLEDWERETLERAIEEDKFIYFVEFKNLGGLPTPLPILFTNEDDSTELVMIPAEIWRRNIKSVSRMFIREKAVKKIVLDPHHEIADADHSNNQFPPSMRSSRLELYKRDNDRRDLMAEMLVKLKPAKSGEEGEDSKDVPIETVEE